MSRSWLSGRRPAAVDHQRRTGDQRGRIGRQVDHGAHHILDPANAPERDLGGDEAPEFAVCQYTGSHGRFDEGGADGVDADAMCPELPGHGLGSAFERMFRGAVDGAPAPPPRLPGQPAGRGRRAGTPGRDPRARRQGRGDRSAAHRHSGSRRRVDSDPAGHRCRAAAGDGERAVRGRQGRPGAPHRTRERRRGCAEALRRLRARGVILVSTSTINKTAFFFILLLNSNDCGPTGFH